MTQAQEIGQQLVSLCNQGQSDEVVKRFYADTIVSIEDQGDDPMPARIEGIDALKAKHDWWNSEVEVHSAAASGPFLGNRPDQFAVHFTLDATLPGLPRRVNSEIALYTLAAGKIVQEEFLPIDQSA